MSNKLITVGMKFGKWTVIGDANPVSQGYLCKCECGTQKRVKQWALLKGKSTQCQFCRYDDLWKSHSKPNKFDLSGEYGIGWTHNTNKKFYFDKDKYDIVKEHVWGETKAHYIVSGHIYLHILLYGKDNIPKNQILTHINKDLADNRLENLKPITKKESSTHKTYNSKIYPGVKQVNNGHFSASIMNSGTKYHLGTYNTVEEAIKARMEAELKYYGHYTNMSKKYDVNNIVIKPIQTRGRNLSEETKELLRKYYPTMGSKVISTFNLNISPKSIHTITSRMGLKFIGKNQE